MKKILGLLRKLPVIYSLKLLLRITAGLLALCVTLLAIAFLVFTFLILPHLDQYRTRLEGTLTRELGRQVTIRQIKGSWHGLAPRFELLGLRIAASSPTGQALTLDTVTVEPSWMSIPALEPRLALIELDTPSIEIIRGHDGKVLLNGFPLQSANPRQGTNPANWLLRQGRIVINNAHLVWQDQYLGLPALHLSDGQLTLTSGLFGHQLSVSGHPPPSVGSAIALSGSWVGNDADHWNDWRGELTADLQGAQVNAWNRYLQTLGLMHSGEGDGHVRLAFADGRINRLIADIKVRNAAWQSPGQEALAVPALGGHLQIVRDDDVYQIEASHLSLLSVRGPIFNDANISGFWNVGAKGGGKLQVDNVDLSCIQPLLHTLDVDKNPLFARFSPAGALQGLSVAWEGRLDAPTQYHIQTGFSQLAWKPFAQVPGVTGVSGMVKFDQHGGQLLLDAASGLEMPRVFAMPLAFKSLRAKLDWRLNGQHVDVNLASVEFANQDMQGQVSGKYQYTGTNSGQLALTGRIGKLAANRLVNYLPDQSIPETAHWLRSALLEGTIEGLQFKLSGEMDKFPFKNGQGGQFQLDTTVKNLTLKFDKDWPAIDQLDARLSMHNAQLSIQAMQARTLGMRWQKLQASIEDLSADHIMLQTAGQMAAPLQDMLRYTTRSPVNGWLSGFTGAIRATGNARLDLALTIPLSLANSTQVKGQLQFADNQLVLHSLPLPPLDRVRGVLNFSERGASSPGVQFVAWGAPMVLRASLGKAAGMAFTVDARQLNGSSLLGQYLPWMADKVKGQSDYHAAFTLANSLQSLQITSTLQGTALDIPAGLGKTASQSLPLTVRLLPVAGTAGELRLELALGSQLAGRQLLNAKGQALATELAAGRALSVMPDVGTALRVALPKIDLKEWAAWGRNLAPQEADNQALRLQLATPDLSWGDKALHNVSLWLGRQSGKASWHAIVEASEMQGAIDYDPSGHGQVNARLEKLSLPSFAPLATSPGTPTAAVAAPTDSADLPVRLPALDVQINKLFYHNNLLGSISLQARYANRDWQLDDVELAMPEGTMSGSLRVLGAGSVVSRFRLITTNAGKLMDRLGSKDTFRQGSGSLTGSLSWPGTLADFDLSRVNGQLGIHLINGQFAKMDPGVSKLLGVLSLQSLPRRIHLDFTDVFSQGFAFDTFAGDASLGNGIFTTRNLAMNGPGADVQIQGQVNLATRTQQLMVHVEPHLAGSVALATGAALINPVIGVATLAAQRVLQDPLSKIFSINYAVSGTFAEPVVKKLYPSQMEDALRKLTP